MQYSSSCVQPESLQSSGVDAIIVFLLHVRKSRLNYFSKSQNQCVVERQCQALSFGFSPRATLPYCHTITSSFYWVDRSRNQST
jgi:hypothetical protein